MNKCLYNGKIIYAFEVAKDFQTEKTIRESKNELFCCDPDCASPVRYKHGPKRVPYFAHICSEQRCDYDKYTNSNSEIFKKIRSELYNHFSKFDEYTVDMDVKLLKNPSHYTPITVCGKEFKAAIDITDKRVTSNTLSERKAKYASLGYTAIQIIVDEVKIGYVGERYDLRFPVKYELNTSANNVAVIAAVGDVIRYAMYKMDTYDYSNPFGSSELNRYNVYTSSFDLSALRVNETGLYVEGFDERYNAWFKQRQNSRCDAPKRTNPIVTSKPVTTSYTTENVKPIVQLNDVVPTVKKNLFENYIKTGKLIGNKIKGKYEDVDLSEIVPNKNTVNYFSTFDKSKMSSAVESAFSGKASDIIFLMNKMYHANDEEKAIFISIFEEYLNLPESEENNAKIKILEHVIEQAEICK